MHGLVVVMAPPPHLAGELRGCRSVDDDEARSFLDGRRGHLQEDANEVGERHAGISREALGPLDLGFRHAHVNLLGMALHRVGLGLRPSWVSKKARAGASRGAGNPPQRA